MPDPRTIFAHVALGPMPETAEESTALHNQWRLAAQAAGHTPADNTVTMRYSDDAGGTVIEGRVTDG